MDEHNKRDRSGAHSNSLRVGAIVGIPVSLEDASASSSPPLQSCLAGHPIGVQSMYIAPCKHTWLSHQYHSCPYSTQDL